MSVQGGGDGYSLDQDRDREITERWLDSRGS